VKFDERRERGGGLAAILFRQTALQAILEQSQSKPPLCLDQSVEFG
jgi:hypothetical protein